MERIEDTISVLIFFIWDTMLANQNDDAVDVEVVTLIIRYDQPSHSVFFGVVSHLFFRLTRNWIGLYLVYDL